MEGAERAEPIEKYEKLVEDYYRELAKKARERQTVRRQCALDSYAEWRHAVTCRWPMLDRVSTRANTRSRRSHAWSVHVRSIAERRPRIAPSSRLMLAASAVRVARRLRRAGEVGREARPDWPPSPTRCAATRSPRSSRPPSRRASRGSPHARAGRQLHSADGGYGQATPASPPWPGSRSCRPATSPAAASTARTSSAASISSSPAARSPA